MFYISEITNTAPAKYRSALQQKVFETLYTLQIPFDRVDTDAAVEMKTCLAIDQKLRTSIVKTLFLCNRQQTQFYLFITCGSKPFSSKNFSAALGISRVSFASSEKLEQMMGSKVGGTSVLGALFENSKEVQIVFDQDTLLDQWFGCSDGTAYSFLKLKTADLLEKILPFAKHDYKIITQTDTGKV